MFYSSLIDVAHLGMLYNVCNYTFSFLKFLRKIYAATIKAFFLKFSLVSLGVFLIVRYFPIVLDILPILLGLLSAYILIPYSIGLYTKRLWEASVKMRYLNVMYVV